MNNLADLEFKQSEKTLLEEKIRAAVAQSGLDGIIALDPGNFTYLTRGVVMPFAGQDITLPSLVLCGAQETADCIVCPVELNDLAGPQGWTGGLVTYSINDGQPPAGLAGAAAQAVSEAKLDNGTKLGFDSEFIPAAVFQALQTALPQVEFCDAGPLLKELREVKTEGERRMIEIAARIAERALVSALNHCEGNVLDSLNYYLWEFGERIRVHVGEFGGSMAGHLSVMQGEKARYPYALLEPSERFKPGSFVRSEWTSHNYGYWASSGRTTFVGPANADSESRYKDNLQLKKVAVNQLKPGVTAAQVFSAVEDESVRTGIPFRRESGAGHGIGTSEMESPYLDGFDQTVLREGMVIVIAIYTYGDQGELICSRDIYEITSDGCRLMSWYKSYEDLYCMYGSTARHG